MGATNLRLQAQRHFVAQLQAELTNRLVGEATTPAKRDAARSTAGCFIVPVFNDKGRMTDSVIRETKSPAQAMVLVMSVIFTDPTKPSIKPALIFGPPYVLKSMYTAGQNIGGRIVTKFTFGKGDNRDIMIGDGTDIPCVNEEGMVIYRTQFWSPDANADDDPMPVIANIEEIRKAKKSTASRYAAAKSTTERKEPEEQVDWERESHADDYKRDAENAIRGMDMETDGFWRDI